MKFEKRDENQDMVVCAMEWYSAREKKRCCTELERRGYYERIVVVFVSSQQEGPRNFLSCKCYRHVYCLKWTLSWSTRDALGALPWEVRLLAANAITTVRSCATKPY